MQKFLKETNVTIYEMYRIELVGDLKGIALELSKKNKIGKTG